MSTPWPWPFPTHNGQPVKPPAGSTTPKKRKQPIDWSKVEPAPF